MTRFLSGWIAALWCFAAWAQTTAAEEPPVDSNGVGTLIFGLLFLGFCVGFFWLVWRNQKKENQDKTAQK